MTSSSHEFRADLAALSAGDLDVQKARILISKALRKDDGIAGQIYDALRGAAWRLISSREIPDDIAEWHDVYTHSVALAVDSGHSAMAERITALSQLVSQTSRFMESQPVNEVMSRMHVVELLNELVKHNGKVHRSKLAEATGLADANLSRVLAILNTHGIIRRKRAGKQAIIEITDLGLAALSQCDENLMHTTPPTNIHWWDRLQVPIAVWDKSGEAVGCNKSFQKLMAMAGYESASAIDKSSWSDWLDKTIVPEAQTNRHCRTLSFSNGVWVRCFEHAYHDGTTYVALIDVSAERIREDAFQRELRSRNEEISQLKMEIADLKRQVADVERHAEEQNKRLLSYTSAVEQVRTKLLEGTYRLGNQVKEWMINFPEGGIWRDRFSDADNRVWALHYAMKNFLITMDATEVPRPPVYDDPYSLIQQSVDTVATLSPQIELSYQLDDKVLGNVDASPFTAAISSAMFSHFSESESVKFLLSTMVRDKQLVVFIQDITKGHPDAASIAELADQPWTSGALTGGMGYSQYLCQKNLGDLFVGMHSYGLVGLRFPLHRGKEVKSKRRVSQY